MVQLTFKKWLKITVILMIFITLVYSMNALFIEKKPIEWGDVMLRSIGMPLFISGFLWLWGDINFKKKKKEEEKEEEDQS